MRQSEKSHKTNARPPDKSITQSNDAKKFHLALEKQETRKLTRGKVKGWYTQDKMTHWKHDVHSVKLEAFATQCRWRIALALPSLR